MARLHAPVANVRARRNDLILVALLALRHALLADFGADLADPARMLRLPQHETRGERADGLAVAKEPEEVGVSESPAFGQAVLARGGTRGGALHALLDTTLNVLLLGTTWDHDRTSSSDARPAATKTASGL
jgi:hypothetical protein